MKAMSEFPKILAIRETSSMASTWNEYLRLDKNNDGTAKLEICQHEALAEAEFDEDGMSCHYQIKSMVRK
jgi:hypothetical protein